MALSLLQELNTGLNIFGGVGIIAGVYVYFRFRISGETIKLYQANQIAFEARVTELEKQLGEANTKINAMQLQLDVVKDLPLRDIQANIAKLLETQNTILTHLQSFPASPVTINAPGVTATTK